MLKIYGEAPDTVSVSIVTVPAVVPGFAARSSGTNGKRYVKVRSPVTFCTFVDKLYLISSTPLILIGVPVVNPWSDAVVTVIIEVGVVASPDIILDIVIGSDPNAPTISNSGLWGASPLLLSGNLSKESIGLAVLLKALIIYYNILLSLLN